MINNVENSLGQELEPAGWLAISQFSHQEIFQIVLAE
jgi:hypothetical protein